MGEQTQLQTLNEFNRKLLPNNHPTTRRVRKVAQRIIEANGLGQMKAGGDLGAIEGKVPSLGGGGGELNMGDIFMGDTDKPVGQTEWEVSRSGCLTVRPD